MPNQTDEQRAEHLRQTLESSTDDAVTNMLEHLRDEGALYAVEPIVELLFAPRSATLRQHVVSMLADIRTPEASDVIASCIERFRDRPELPLLVSVCWQSRLSFAEHALLLIDLLRREPLDTGIEAYSVLDVLLPQLSPEQQAQHVQLLRQGPATEQAQGSTLLMQSLVDKLLDQS